MKLVIIIWLFIGAFVAGYQHHYYEKKEKPKILVAYILLYIFFGGFFLKNILKRMFHDLR